MTDQFSTVIAEHAECLRVRIDNHSLFVGKQNADGRGLRKEAVTLFGQLQSLLYQCALFYLGKELTGQLVPLDGIAKNPSQLAAVYLALDDVIVRTLPQCGDPQLFILKRRKNHDACALCQRHDAPQGFEAGCAGKSQVE